MKPYVRHPAVSGDRVVFVTDDDLWTAPVEGGPTRRLTAVQGVVAHPMFSPDGAHVAYRSTRDGADDVYVCDAHGGPSRRVTFLGTVAAVCGFTPDGDDIVFASAAGRPSVKEVVLWTVPMAGGEARPLEWGLGIGIAYGPDGAVAIARHSDDLARWKRYRGGRRGAIWVSPSATAMFHKLDVRGAAAVNPMFIGGRLWFVSDRSYVANLWSCALDGTDMRQETDHDDAVRHATTDGTVIVYVCGARLMRLVPGTPPAEVPLDHASPAEQLGRRYVSATAFLEDARLHPDGRSLALVVRGKPVTVGTWEGAPLQHGRRHGARYRLLSWLPDGERLVCATDESGEECLAVIEGDTVRQLAGTGPARTVELLPAPTGAMVAFADDRNDLRVVDLDSGAVTHLEHNTHGRCGHLAWSHDGRWLAWRSPAAHDSTSRIRLWCAEDGRTADVTDGRFDDFSPTFDPLGRFLAFLTKREFDPVYDQAFFDVNFPLGVRPYLVTLAAGAEDPTRPAPRPLAGGPTPRAPERLDIDLDGIASRIAQVPMPSRRYLRLRATPTALVADSEPVAGATTSWTSPGPPPANRDLHVFHWERLAETNGFPKHSDFEVSHDGASLLLRVRDRLRVVAVPAPEAKLPTGRRAGRKTGWVDLSRVTVAIEPRREWAQMLRETWRWMRDHFWVPDHSGVDWEAAWERYAPRLDQVVTRTEYADLVWTMVGELATSHCYEMLGDYRKTPGWRVGHLGAAVTWDAARRGWRLERIAVGEPGDPGRSSPLAGAGAECVPGDVITAIDGLPATAAMPVGAHLVDRGGKPTAITVRRASGGEDTITVTPLVSDADAWYREWVRTNRARVHDESDGRVGYVHIPDMGPGGFADFHRDYLRESQRDALIVDVRYNRGGHVSQLILEKLRRKPIGYSVSRWEGTSTYPTHAVRGPIVAVTNEMAGSDGDIFSHCFKLYGIGPLIGTRTWGGVIGIWPRAAHADRSITTQPEFSFWFTDVGFGVENHGTEPDIEVEHTPEDWADGRDRQLERAIEEVQRLLALAPVEEPDISTRPYLGPTR